MKRVDQVKALHDLENQYLSVGSFLSRLKNFRDHLPNEDVSFLQQNALLLTDYLQKHDQPVPEPLFVELACFVPGISKGINPPLEVLRKNRGGFSEPRIERAANWIQSAQAFTRHFKSCSLECLDRMLALMDAEPPKFDGDMYRFVAIYADYKRRIYDEGAPVKMLSTIRQLNAAEVEQLARYALELGHVGETHHESAVHLLYRLMCLHPDTFPPIHMQMLEAGLDDPPILGRSILFNDAPLEVSKALVEKLAVQTERQHLTLDVFVWGNDPFVEQQMDRWRKQPPAWWRADYADRSLEAGWELTADGQRRKLYFDTCYALVPTEGECTTEVTTPREDSCPWCQQPLENLLDLDLTDSRLSFLQLEGTRLRMPFCPWCHAFKTQFFEVDFEGHAHWSTYNDSEPPFRIESYESAPNTLSLAPTPRGTYEALLLNYNNDMRTSQVGGYPFWDYARFPECPSCQQHMLFIGEVDWGDVADYGGWSYAYLCPTCKLTAANYFNT